jgi:predicted GIY-YIG superfamily endonuclease
MQNADRRAVYVLRSQANPARHYSGITADLRNRFEHHNAGQSTHTRRDRPWTVVVALGFADADAASRFERYLKSPDQGGRSQRGTSAEHARSQRAAPARPPLTRSDASLRGFQDN